MNRTTKGGFTLVELMVGLAISLLLMGGGMVALSQFGERRAVLADAKLVADQLRALRIRAVAVETPEVCVGGVVEYQMTLSESTMEMKVECVNESLVNWGELTLQNSSFSDSTEEVDFQVRSGGSLGGVKIIYVCGEKTGFRIEVTETGLVGVPTEDFSGCTG